MVTSIENGVPRVVPAVEHLRTPELQSPPGESSAPQSLAGPCFVGTTPARTTYDLVTASRPRSRSIIRSSRRYSRHATSILTFFHRHRIALASHIQRQFPNLFRSDRSTRMHLQTLVAHGDLTVREGQIIGQANVYTLTQKGLRTTQELRDSDPDTLRRLRRRSPTGNHFLHELLITEVAVSLTQAIRARPDLAIPWEERFGLIGKPAFTDLIPDYEFLLQQAQGLLACLVEVSSGEDSPTRIGQKLREYANWSMNPVTHEFLTELYRRHGAQNPRPHYRLLLVAHDRKGMNDRARIRQILWQTLSLPRIMRQRIWLTSIADLGGARSIDEPLWMRAKDLDEHIPRWETRPQREQRRVFHEIVRGLPRHRLFPPAETSPDVPAP